MFGTHLGVSTIMCKVFNWKRSRISVLEAEAIPQSYTMKRDVREKVGE
jgi:hypothetical protein